MKTTLRFFLFCIFSVSLFAQTKDAGSFDKGTHEWSVWAGGSPNSPQVFGSVKDRKLTIVGLRHGWVFAATKNTAWEFISDIVPYSMVYQPTSVRIGSPRAQLAVRGRGGSPFGLKVNFNRQNKIKPFVNVSGGYMIFEKGTPVEVLGATRWNFTFEFGGGIQIPVSERTAFSVGYKLHHFSNARFTNVNPGMDSNVIYAGFSFLR